MLGDKVEKPLRILVVDDHPIMREGIEGAIRRQPDMQVVGGASDGAEAVERYRELRPDVVLMDLQMPGMGGVEAITQIRQEDPAARIIVLTTYSGDMRALRALKAGAAGYLLKGAVRKELLSTIRSVYDGVRSLPADIATEIAVHAADEPLTARELEVLCCLAEGHANKQIAWRLSISEDTVKTHLKSVFTKLNATDRTGAVTIAARRGIIDM
jgi:DNA-binding NarL/FixJ family response regulator